MNQKLKRAYLNAWQALYRVLPKYQVNNQFAHVVDHVKSRSAHVFRGYYDIDFFDDAREKFLIHILPKEKETGNCIGIGYYDLLKKEIVQLTESHAWCWQQGSRLRWLDSTNLLFNDCLSGKYISRVVNVETKVTVRQFDAPLYDVASDKGFGLSLNFSRLQRLRPGYGYKTLEDSTIGIIASEDDGIFYVDLHSNEKKLIVSLRRLHELIRPELDGEDYINHICLSPDKDSFIFFYIVTDKPGRKSKVYLCWSDVDGKNINILESDVQTSHYTWLNNAVLLTTYLKPNDGMKQGYRLYDISKGCNREYGNGILTLDGHPTFISNESIVTDTYPQVRDGNNQYLRVYDDQNHALKNIGRFFQDVRYSGEKRCDLHPSVCGDYISVDTSCNGLRSVVLIKRN